MGWEFGCPWVRELVCLVRLFGWAPDLVSLGANVSEWIVLVCFVLGHGDVYVDGRGWMGG